MYHLGRVVARNAAAGMAAQIAIKLLSFAFSVLVIRRLGVETYGQYAAVTAFGALFVSFADLGLSPYTVREVARSRDAQDGLAQARGLLTDVLWLRMILAALAASMIILTGWLTDRPPAMMLGLALGAVGLLIYGAQGAFEAVVAGNERLDWLAGARVLQQLTFVLLGAIVLLLGLSYHSLIVANIIGICVLMAVVVMGAHRLGLRPGAAHMARWGALLRAAIPFGIIGLALGLSYKFDSVLLNIYHGDAATGLYNAAYTLIFAAVVISNVINTSLYPSLARQSSLNPAALPSIYNRSLKLLAIISLPIAVGGWVVAPLIVGTLFGDQYVASAHVLQIMIWAIPLMYASEFMGYIVVIEGRERRVARAVIVSTAANILGNALLIPRFGVPAAAVMTVLTEVVLVLQYTWLLRSTLYAMNAARAVLRPLLAALIMGACCYVVAGRWPLPATIALGAAIYVAALLLTGAVVPADWRGLIALWNRRSLPHAGDQPAPEPVK